jgi:16S rRNA (guanine527-N7)-methyltransferase
METLQVRAANLALRARNLSVDLPEAAAGTLLRYLDHLLEINQSLNLTGIRDPVVAIERHLVDSLAFGLHVALTAPPRVVIDVGTGGGFPGVPIAAAWPDAHVHLLDATRKKIDAIRTMLDDTGIANADAHWGRAESIRGLPRADSVVARAVGPLADIVTRASPLVARGGHLVVWKSHDLPDSERRDAERLLQRLGMESRPDLEYELDRRLRLVRYRRRTT